jgi:hypothetical protein
MFGVNFSQRKQSSVKLMRSVMGERVAALDPFVEDTAITTESANWWVVLPLPSEQRPMVAGREHGYLHSRLRTDGAAQPWRVMCGQLLLWQWQCEERSGVELLGELSWAFCGRKSRSVQVSVPEHSRAAREGRAAVGELRPERSREEGERWVSQDRERERERETGRVKVNRTMQGCFLSLAEAEESSLFFSLSQSWAQSKELTDKVTQSLLWQFFQTRVARSDPTIKGTWFVAKGRMSFALGISQSGWERIQFKLLTKDRETCGQKADGRNNQTIYCFFNRFLSARQEPNNIFKQSSKSIIWTFIEIKLFDSFKG